MWRWVCPLELATLATHGPMPWFDAEELADTDALQLLTAEVTASPWVSLLLLSLEFADSLLWSLVSELDSSEWLLLLTVSTVWLL